MFKGIIFDLDGTLFDSETAVIEGWISLYKELGVPVDMSLFVQDIGKGINTFDPAEFAFKHSDKKLSKERLRLLGRDKFLKLVEKVQLFPGVIEILNFGIKNNIKLGVSSNSTYSWVEINLSRLDILKIFDGVTGIDKAGKIKMKPDPDTYLKTLEKIELSASDCVAVEDSPLGVKAAKNAGLYTIAIPNKHIDPTLFGEADMIIDSIQNFPKEILQLG